MEKMDFRTVDSKTRTAIRKRALQQIQQGVKKKAVALNYGVNVNTITSWVKKHNSKGSKGLVDNKRGVKSEEKKLLSSVQEKDVQKMILDTMQPAKAPLFVMDTQSCDGINRKRIWNKDGNKHNRRLPSQMGFYTNLT